MNDSTLRKYIERINDPNPVVWVILGQAYNETALADLLDSALAHPKARGRWNSAKQNAELARALGLVHPEIPTVLEKLGGLRNRLAHRLDVEVVPEDQVVILNAARAFDSFDETLRELPGPGRLDFPEGIRWVMAMMWQYLAAQTRRMNEMRPNMTAVWDHLDRPPED